MSLTLQEFHPQSYHDEGVIIRGNKDAGLCFRELDTWDHIASDEEAREPSERYLC